MHHDPTCARPVPGMGQTTPPASVLSGWGRHSASGIEIAPTELLPMRREISLARGLGRSYGDASLPASPSRWVVNTKHADRILSFDPSTGVLRAEAGLSLDALNKLLMPRGFFPPVTPGTKFVTLGGAVAADVHGKNQHAAGNIGHHVRSLRMLVADGRILECSREEYPDLFLATLGGMGLTGIILEVELTMQRIPTSWIAQESKRIHNLAEFEAEVVGAAAKWPFTMAWMDCMATGKRLGRGLMMCGRWAEPGEAPAHAPGAKPLSRVPFDFPELTLNPYTIRVFNESIYWRQLRDVDRGLLTADQFWYPLDSVLDWNRAYGRRGFTQYQFVLPRGSSGGVQQMVEHLQSLGGPVFLAVLKDFGRESEGTISFPTPGVTLAIDLPIRDDTQKIVDSLNEKLISYGGRIYLAKDSFTRGEHYRAMDPRVREFEAIRDRWDPNRRWKSALSVRVFGDEP